MSSGRWFGKLCVVIAVALCASGVFAGAFGAHGPKRKIVTLIVTANYDQPRLLAELIQLETNQPILLIPAKGQGEVYFCPPVATQAARPIAEKDVARDVHRLNPQQIIVLGDKRYVPEKYLKMFGNDVPVVVISCSDWQKVADMLNPMLNLIRVDKNFAKLSPQLRSNLYEPKSSASAAPRPMLRTDDGDDVPARTEVPNSATREPELLPDML